MTKAELLTYKILEYPEILAAFNHGKVAIKFPASRDSKLFVLTDKVKAWVKMHGPAIGSNSVGGKLLIVVPTSDKIMLFSHDESSFLPGDPPDPG